MDDWNHIQDVAIRIVPTNAAETKVMEEFFGQPQTVSFIAFDEVKKKSQRQNLCITEQNVV